MMGTSYSTPFGILKYDGSSVIDLTEKFLSLKFPKTSLEAELETPATSPPPQTPSSEPTRGVCGPIACALNSPPPLGLWAFKGATMNTWLMKGFALYPDMHILTFRVAYVTLEALLLYSAALYSIYRKEYPWGIWRRWGR